MNARTIQPLTAAGVAVLLTAAPITTAGIHSADVSASLRTEFAAVQLQALAVSALPAAAVAPAAAVTPSAAVTAAAAVDPIQMVADVIRNAVSLAAAALWYAAFPITLPLSVIGGLVASAAQTASAPQASAPASPMQGLVFFFTAPNILLTTGFANVGMSFNMVQHQINMPFSFAAAPRAAAAAKRAVAAPATPVAASARSAKKPAAAAAHSGPKAAKRAVTARNR